MNSNNNVSKMIACANWNCLRNRKNALNKLKGLSFVRSQKWAIEFSKYKRTKTKIHRKSRFEWNGKRIKRRRINWPHVKGEKQAKYINITAISNKTSKPNESN